MYRINNIFRYNDGGQLAEEWAQYDSRLFLESLGVPLGPAKGIVNDSTIIWGLWYRPKAASAHS